MTADPARLARLAEIAGLLRDRKLTDLRAAAAAIAESRDRLAALAPAAVTDPAVDPVALARAALRYELWADGRRAEINRGLARQTVAWIAARDAAAAAYGRARAMEQLAAAAAAARRARINAARDP
jgi:hypothetical protein